MQHQPLIADEAATQRTVGGIRVIDPTQARLMRELLHKAMADCAGEPVEATYAFWNIEIARLERCAASERWPGWEAYHPDPGAH